MSLQTVLQALHQAMMVQIHTPGLRRSAFMVHPRILALEVLTIRAMEPPLLIRRWVTESQFLILQQAPTLRPPSLFLTILTHHMVLLLPTPIIPRPMLVLRTPVPNVPKPKLLMLLGRILGRECVLQT